MARLTTKKRKPGGQLSHDWPGLYQEYLTQAKRPDGKDLKRWVPTKDLVYTVASRQFAQLGRQITGDTLSMLAPRAAQRLGEFVDSKLPDFALRASTAILDRSGFSPQAVAIQINQQTNVQFQIPPLFASDYTGKVNKLIQPTVIDAP